MRCLECALVVTFIASSVGTQTKRETVDSPAESETSQSKRSLPFYGFNFAPGYGKISAFSDFLREVPDALKYTITEPFIVPINQPIPVEITLPVLQTQHNSIKIPLHVPETYPVELEIPFENSIPVIVEGPVATFEKLPFKVPIPADRVSATEVKLSVPEPVPIECPNSVAALDSLPVKIPVEVPIRFPSILAHPIPVPGLVAKTDIPETIPVKVSYPVLLSKPLPVEVEIDKLIPFPVESGFPLLGGYAGRHFYPH